MKKTLFIPLFFCALTISAQQYNMIDSISVLQNEINEQKIEIRELKQILQSQNASINQQSVEIQNLKIEKQAQNNKLDSLLSVAQTNSNYIRGIEDDLGTKIEKTQITANDGFARLDNSLSKTKPLWTESP